MATDLFMANREIKVSLKEGAIAPTRAHDEDARLDLYATRDEVVPAGGSRTFDTGVCVELPEIRVESGGVPVVLRTAGFLKSKSGLNVKHGIVSEGVIDCGYTGSIVVKLYNHGTEDHQVKRGDKITQLCIVPVLTPQVRIVDTIEGGDRGEGGFGSVHGYDTERHDTEPCDDRQGQLVSAGVVSCWPRG